MNLRQGKHSKNVSWNLINENLCVLITLISIIIMLYSGFRIFSWRKENTQNKKMQDEISNKVIINENADINSEEYLQNKYKIDFETLEQMNKDIIGWIKVEETNIEHTVLQSKDNEFYLNHNFNKKSNSAGWIFADYTNKLDGTDQNIVIYGHNRRDGSMFSTLKNILKEEWYLNKNNRQIPFITKNEESIYEVFSVYQIEDEDYYIKTNFENDNFKEFLDKIKDRSIYDFNVDIGEEDKILTLSTCANDNRYRVVLHAKKINN